MTKILLLTEKANVTQMQPKKVRQLPNNNNNIFKENNNEKAIIFPPHA